MAIFLTNSLAPETRALLNVAAGVGIVAVLWGLAVMLCRERLKNHLRERGFQPARIRWLPLASSRIFCRFEARYQDAGGILQRGCCAIEWLRGDVIWETGEHSHKE